MSLFYGGLTNNINTYSQQISSTLETLNDVQILSANNDQVLTYEDGFWKNKDSTAGSGFITAISDDILKNKTIDDISNIVTCDKLRCSGGTISINLASAPTTNQSLIATGSTGASWQSIHHVNLSNKGPNTHTN